MMTALVYLFKVQVVFTMLFILYYAFLRREKFLVLNRFILAGIVAMAFVLPVSRTFTVTKLNVANLQVAQNRANVLPKIIAYHQSPQNTGTANQVNYITLAMLAYLAVSVVLLMAFFVNLHKVYKVISRSHRRKAGRLVYCEPFNETAPFSFFNYIVIAKKALTPVEYKQIITHERAHSCQLHSLDVLLADAACILLWINPLVYIYRGQVKLNLEFLADEAALNSGLNARDYQLSLLRYSGMLSNYRPVNAFFTSKIKQRIVMMNTTAPGLCYAGKYLLLLPVLLILSLLVGFQKASSATGGKISLLNNTGMIGYKPRQVIQSAPIKRNVPTKQAHKQLTNTPAGANQPTTAEQDNTNVFVDARTDTVKFTLINNMDGRRFKGIYVVEDKILTDDEIRAGIKQTGTLEMIMANRPIVGAYSPGDSSAIKKWGEQARLGVVFVKSRPVKNQ